MLKNGMLQTKSVAIASFALCGFANLSSVAMQIGGIGEMAPSRKGDLARLGLWALLCGTLASYVSSALAGMLVSSPGQTEQWEVALLLMVLAAGVMTANNLMFRRKPVSVDAQAGAAPVVLNSVPSIRPVEANSVLAARGRDDDTLPGMTDLLAVGEKSLPPDGPFSTDGVAEPMNRCHNAP
jgi:MFS family permease